MIHETKYKEFESFANNVSNESTILPSFNTSSKKRKIVDTEISDKFVARWKLFPYKLIELVNCGNLTELIKYVKNYLDPKCICQFSVIGGSVVKQGPQALISSFQTVMNTYPDYVMTVCKVNCEIVHKTMQLTLIMTNTGTCMEPSYLGNFVNLNIENNIFSLDHDLGRKMFHLPKLNKSELNNTRNNKQENHISKDVLKLKMNIKAIFYINLETNMAEGLEAQSKISSYEVNSSKMYY